MPQPIARVDPVYDTYFGTTIVDPYQWMEQTASDEFQTWISEQGLYARAYLDALPERASLLDRVRVLRRDTPRIYDLKIADRHAFYRRAVSDGKHAILYMRHLPDGPEQMLYDSNELHEQPARSLEWYVPSPDGRHLLCNMGIEEPSLHVLRVGDGTFEDLGIKQVGYDDGSSRGNPCWLPDGSGIVYPRFGATWLHWIGDPPGQETLIWGHQIANVPIKENDQAFIALSTTSDWMLGVLFHGDQHECTIYTAPVTSLSSAPATIPWVKVVGVEHDVVGYALHSDIVYLRTHHHAPRYQIVSTSLRHPDIESARVLVPSGPAVIQGMLIAGQYVLLQTLEGGVGRLQRVPLTGGQPEVIALPFDGSIDLFNNWNSMPFANDANGPDVFFMLQSWTRAPLLYRCNTVTGNVIDTMWQPSSSLEDPSIVTNQVFVPGRDGTPIPLWLIHRGNLVHDERHPTILYTYGSYGLAMTPYFWVEMLAWYEQGGILAIAGVRGGGEYGREWHEAGMLQNKANTIEDYIACAEYLIAQRYTQPQKLAGMGISAGSYPVGGALVRRPELWNAIVINVGEPNTIRKEQHTTANIPEIGTVTTEEGFAALRITDSYGRVEHRVAYPAVLMTTGGRDIIVPMWQAAKMTARLQAASSSGKPVLLRFEEEIGHVPETEQQWAEIHADMFAFMLDQLKR